MKKLLSAILASTMILGSLSTTAMAQEMVEIQTATLSSPLSDFVIENGVITKYTGSGGAVVIPNTVTKIGDNSFAGCTTVTSVVLPDTVKEIGGLAFYRCTSLVSIDFGNSLSVIGDKAFDDCSSLTSVVIPNSVKEIGSMAFSGCKSLVSAVLPNSITEISEYLFYGCNALTTVNIPDTVTVVGNSAFQNCSSLTALALPDSVSVLGYHAFAGCTALTSLTIPNGVTKLSSNTFKDCTSLTSITIPNGLTDLGISVFYGCSSLTTVILPVSLSVVGADSFNYCTALETVHYSGSPSDKANMDIRDANDPFVNANWIFNSTGPSAPSEPTAPTAPTSPTGAVYDTWAAGIVDKASSNDLLVNGLGMDYTKTITRLQIAELLVNMIEKYTNTSLNAAGATTFTDTADASVLKAYSAGLISGKGNNLFDPYATATRQELAIMFYNTVKKMEEISGNSLINHSATTVTGFHDFGTTAIWAQNAMAIMVNATILGGSEGNLKPEGTATIQEALVMNNNLFQLS